MRIIPALIAFLLVSSSALAQEPSLGWPVACAEGKNCWVVHHVDQDTSPAAQDFHCGHLTYDGHDGTDIAVRDFATMQSGLDVLAALNGKVVRVRNDIDDHHGTAADLAAAKQSKKECGNLVSILHAGKWVTEYCHMKKGSIAVAMGQTVAKGTKLGQVGQSGLAEFPHLHFSLRHNNAVIDPFTGKGLSGCGATGEELWEHDIPYEGIKIYAAGFAGEVPNASALNLNAEQTSRIQPNSAALVFWMALYGLEAGDKINMTVISPDGKVFVESNETAAKQKIRYFQYAGKKNQMRLMPGEYQGTATVTRTLPDGSFLTRKAEKSLIIR
jgi:hypothetical protein